MSHAANLRSSQRAQELSSKKRKLSESSTRPHINGINGLLSDNATSKISAVPTKDVKALKQKQSGNLAAKIGHADGDVNVTKQLPESDDTSSTSSDSEDDVEDESDEGHGVRIAKQGDQKVRHKEKRRKSPSTSQPTVNGTKDGTVAPREQSAEAGIEEPEGEQTHKEVPEDQGQLSFGDLLRSREGALIDIASHDEEEEAPLTAPAARTSTLDRRPPPNANSLGTVLSQALRTNDTPMLESCLQVANLQSIRATVERLPSQQAGDLLQKLAERMHKRPGRAGSLMVWIQWTVVAHGGYLATQPVVMSHLRELYRVVKMRAQALQPLLALKGKLDMLEAQLQLRKNRAAQNPQARSGRDEGVIYIEGEESPDSDDELEEADGGAHGMTGATSKPGLHRDLTFDTDEEADDLPMVNGITEGDVGDMDDDEEEGSEDDDDEDLIDDEAESADSDEDMSDEEIDFEDVDGTDASERSEEEEPAPKRSKTKRR